jgi:polyferredoxin
MLSLRAQSAYTHIRDHRQQIRGAFLLASLLLFPVTLFYFSPMLILESATRGIINGSFIVFALMSIASLFVGRLYCAWLCPGAGQMETSFAFNARPLAPRWVRWIKWAIWVPWIGALAALAIGAGGYRAMDARYGIESGVSVLEPIGFIVFYAITGLTLVLSIVLGKRGFCHSVCWMAPFMIVGRKVSNALRLPALRLQASSENCTRCHRCDRHCPMSLEVSRMVQVRQMEHSDCILCGNCIDACQKNVIAYRFKQPVKGE